VPAWIRIYTPMVCHRNTYSFLSVRKDNVTMESLYHKQCLTQCTRAFAQHLDGWHYERVTCITCTIWTPWDKLNIFFRCILKEIRCFRLSILTRFHRLTHLIRFHGYDGTESKYKGMNILHVEVVGCHGIWHRVISQYLLEDTKKQIPNILNKPVWTEYSKHTA